MTSATQAGRATVDDVLAQVRELRADVARGNAELCALRLEVQRVTQCGPHGPPRPLAPADSELLGALLPVMAEFAPPSLMWTAGEIFAQADEPDAGCLRTALAQIGSARALGKLLRRAVGVPIGGFVVERIADCRDGALWRVSVGADWRETRPHD
jgi:hypothetical protein